MSAYLFLERGLPMFWFVIVLSGLAILAAMLRSRHFVKAVLLSLIQGGAALFAVNFVGDFIGVHIPLNVFSCSVGGLAGIPGVILLLISDIIL